MIGDQKTTLWIFLVVGVTETKLIKCTNHACYFSLRVRMNESRPTCSKINVITTTGPFSCVVLRVYFTICRVDMTNRIDEPNSPVFKMTLDGP